MLNRTLSIISFILFFLSFSYNIFGVSNDFDTFQNDSEILVIDGLNHYNSTGNFHLGYYGNLTDKGFYSKAVEHFDNATKNNEKFTMYTSQYGLQGEFFLLLTKLFHIKSIFTLKVINAVLFSLLLTSVFYWISININKGSAIIFALSMIFSPWVVDFSNNLYWVPFTWVLPFAIILTYSVKAVKNNLRMYFFFITLLVAFYIKFMSGYEYITTIGMLSVFPLIFYLNCKIIDKKQAFKMFIVISISFVSAFALSLQSYVNKYGTENLSTIIAKRMSVGEIKNIDDCEKYSEINKKDCDILVRSLNSNVFKVVGDYLFSFNGFFPYSKIDKYAFRVNLRSLKSNSLTWKKFKENPSIQSFLNVENTLKFKIVKRTLLDTLNLLFPIILLLVFSLARKNKRQLLMFAYAFVCPLSWFILAKGHSYIHTHLNYILWYMPLVPVMFIYLYNYHLSGKQRLN